MTMDLDRARRFIEAVPDGSWTTYKDVATAAGNSNGAMAIGTWLRNSGGAIKNYWRVLNVKGVVPDAFVGGGSGPLDAVAARDLLRREGVGVDADGRVRQRQRFTYEDWIRLQRDRGGGVVPAAKPPAHLQPTTPETTSEPRISGTLTVRHHRSGKVIADQGAVRTVPDAIICADWSKYPGKRQAWIAEPQELRLRPLRASSLTVRTLVEAAECTLREGFVLVAFDAPIGVPSSYLDAARTILNMEDRTTFVDWLPIALGRAGFCDPVRNPEDWSPARPFFQVQAGEGGRKMFEVAAAAYGIDLWRGIEKETRGNSVFAFGLPGQVAPAAQALWRELVAALDTGVAIWPFDGSLEELAARRSVIACEIYPRAAYGTALGAALPARQRSIAKTKPEVRAVEVASLKGAEWVRTWEVEIEPDALAVESEDHFDALMTAAAVLRLTLECLPLTTFACDSVAEGAILCA
jgi:alkylated DNA nucleotide flippase Atl1